MPKRIVIVGAGISGLSTAYYLQETYPLAEITLLEARNRVGGRIWTERRDGYQAEEGDEGFYGYQPGVWKLCRKLGIAVDVIPPSTPVPHRYLLREKKLCPIPHDAKSTLRCPMISWKEMWRIFRERSRNSTAAQNDESVYEMLERRFSPAIADKFADLLVTESFAVEAKFLSFAACFPKWAQAEQEYGSLTRGIPKINSLYVQERLSKGETLPPSRQLLSFRLGMRVLLEAIQSKLKNPPITDQAVDGVFQAQDWDAHRYVVRCKGKESWPADVVVLCCPAPRQAALLAELDGDLADALLNIDYIPQVTVSLGYRKAQATILTQTFGYTSSLTEKRDVLAVHFDSSRYAKRAPENHILVRAVLGSDLRKEICNWDDDKIIQATRQELKKVAGIKGPPTFMHLSRSQHALPVYKVGHFDKVQRIDALTEKHQGLYLAGNAFDGVTINHCVQQARLTAYNIAQHLSQPT